MNLRPYQSEAVESILDSFDEHPTNLMVAATGVGKTIMFAHVIDRMKPGRVMVVAHREELVRQGANKIWKVTGEEPGIEMAGEWVQDMGMFTAPRIVVSTIQTQVSGVAGAGRMSRFPPDDFTLLVCDESHHAVSPSWERVIDYYRRNPDLKVLGVTATPDRHDEVALGRVFENVAFTYEIDDAIGDGWLVPMKQEFIWCEHLDFSACRTTKGDLNPSDLARIMEFEEALHEVVSPMLEIVGNRKTLVFTASVAHAERVAEIIDRAKPGSARWICGKTPRDERRQIVADFAASRFQYLVNCAVFLEGFDDPGIEVVAIARPTKSRSLYAQMCGRGMRTFPSDLSDRCVGDNGARHQAIRDSSKPQCLILDFVGNAGRHKLICTADILGGKYEDVVVAKAAAAAQAKGGAVDMAEQLEFAQEELESEQKKKRQAVMARAKYGRRSIDPFLLLDIAPRRERGWDQGRRCTPKMVAMLERNKVQGAGEMSFMQGRQVITTIIQRGKADLCTLKQCNLLAGKGIDAKDWKFGKASAAIDQIAKNKWQVPEGMDVS